MVGSVVFILGLIAIIVGAIFIDGWVSWLVVIVGVILQALGKMFSQVEVTGKTDETILRLLFLASYIVVIIVKKKTSISKTDDEKDFLETIADMIKIDKSKALAKLK